MFHKIGDATVKRHTNNWSEVIGGGTQKGPSLHQQKTSRNIYYQALLISTARLSLHNIEQSKLPTKNTTVRIARTRISYI